MRPPKKLSGMKDTARGPFSGKAKTGALMSVELPTAKTKGLGGGTATTCETNTGLLTILEPTRAAPFLNSSTSWDHSDAPATKHAEVTELAEMVSALAMTIVKHTTSALPDVLHTLKKMSATRPHSTCQLQHEHQFQLSSQAVSSTRL